MELLPQSLHQYPDLLKEGVHTPQGQDMSCLKLLPSWLGKEQVGLDVFALSSGPPKFVWLNEFVYVNHVGNSKQ